MQSQKHLFQLPDHIHYLNCAYMSPLLKSVESKGIEGVQLKRNPVNVTTHHFFDEIEEVKSKFGKIVNGTPSRIAFIPSASYGLSTAINNIPFEKGKHALTIGNEFPSGYFTAKRWCEKHQAELKVVLPENPLVKGRDWNNQILEAIRPETAFVVLSSVHWMDGTWFDLEAIGKRCSEVNALFIVDGTQSVGALPIDVKRYHIDALICAGYKWLMSPYSSGLAYFGKAFDEGIPLEETWMNRTNAHDFAHLTDYEEQYGSDANRYNVGQYSNFILVPMVNEALQQLLHWSIESIPTYCQQLTLPLFSLLEEIEAPMEEESYRVHHLFSLNLPDLVDTQLFSKQVSKRNIHLSHRGSSIRVSPHLYNTEEDIAELADAIKSSIR